MGQIKSLVLFGLIFLAIGCTTGHCRRQGGSMETDQSSSKVSEDSVQVYKYDGSKQCGMGKGLDLDSMAKDLGSVQIMKKEKKPDGLMHVQVCGSNTGLANVYTIPKAALETALNAGFKEWKF